MAYVYSGFKEGSNKLLYETYHINFSEERFLLEESYKEKYLEEREFGSNAHYGHWLWDIRLGIIRKGYKWNYFGRSYSGFYCRVCDRRFNRPRDISECSHTAYNDKYASYVDTEYGRRENAKQEQKRQEESYERKNELLKHEQNAWEAEADRKEAELFIKTRFIK